MTSARLSRRTFLGGAAAGAALLAIENRRAPAALADAVNLEFWTPANDPVGSGIITKLVDEFNNTVGQQQGIHVNTRIKPVTADNYVQYTTAMTSSGSPDVVMTYVYKPVAAWAGNGFIRPMDDYAQAAGIKQSDFFPIAWSMINFGGHIWGLLQEFDFNQFWWNKSIHAGSPPTTIDELDALAAKYTQFDKDGNLTQAGLIPWMNFTGTNWNVVWGGRFYDSDARKWTINTPQNRKFLEWFLKYVQLFGGRDKSDALESSIPKTYGDIFQYGKVAFAQEGEFLPAELKQQGLALQYGIAQTPTAAGVPAGTAETSGGNLFLLPTKAGHPKEAATFIQYMGSTDGALKWCIPNSNIPPVMAAALAPSFQQALPELKPWLDTLQLNHMVPPSPSPQFPLFDQSMNGAIDEVTYKKKSPEEALAGVADKVAAAVQRFQQSHPDWPGE